jgi:chromosome segregation ATPase
VLARQRELAELEHAIGGVRDKTAAARDALTAVEAELDDAQQRYHGESMAFSSQQRRCHDLELELLQLKQTAEAAEARRAQIAVELDEIAAQEAAARAQGDALARELSDAQIALHDIATEREAKRQDSRTPSLSSRAPVSAFAWLSARAGSRLRRAQLPRAPGRARAQA